MKCVGNERQHYFKGTKGGAIKHVFPGLLALGKLYFPLFIEDFKR